jgi:hypothetical protein
VAESPREERVLITRLWFHGDGSQRQLVGRMATIRNIADVELVLGDVKSLEEILNVTERWVREFLDP